MTINKIMIIAAQTRSDFEQKAIEVPYIETLVKRHLSYIAISYKEDLTQWIAQSLEGFPNNCCELASVVLLDRMKEGEIVYGRYKHEPIGPHNMRKSHTFWAQAVPIGGDTLIADITADQYGGPPIYVGKHKRPWTIPDWSKNV